VFGYDTSPNREPEATDCGIAWTESIGALAQKLPSPRLVWIMVPAGLQTQEAIESASASLSTGDIIIDGGNSFYRDSIRRASLLREQGISFLDIGVSGGVHGRNQGYCLMVGGDEKAFRTAEPLFADLAATKGYSRVGGPGSGHFAKMVHNAIEYAALQAYGEGFELLEASGFDYDLAALADLWNHGSVIRSWLLDLAKRAFEKSPDLAGIRGWVEDSGEGRWALEEAIDLDVPAPVIALSLMMRFHSRQDDSFSAKLIAALREQFGGHEVKES
jgi:6-phosphogluconate dehydrogenase